MFVSQELKVVTEFGNSCIILSSSPAVTDIAHTFLKSEILLLDSANGFKIMYLSMASFYNVTVQTGSDILGASRVSHPAIFSPRCFGSDLFVHIRKHSNAVVDYQP